MNELETWLSAMAGETTYDSSGIFTLKVEAVPQALASLLSLNPSLPWLRLVQWAHRCGASSVTLDSASGSLVFQAHGIHDCSDWIQALKLFPGGGLTRDSLSGTLSLLQAHRPKSLHVKCRGTATDFEWSRDGAFRAMALEAGQQPCLEVRAELVVPGLVEEFRQRTHFAPIPILLDGQPHSSDLDVTSLKSRQFGVGCHAGGMNYFAAAPPMLHEARMVLVNNHLAASRCGDPAGLQQGLKRVACYHLKGEGMDSHHTVPSASTWEGMFSQHPDRLSLLNDGSWTYLNVSRKLLCPVRGFRLPSGEMTKLHPLRAERLFLLSNNPDRGEVRIVPVRDGVCLNPIKYPGSRGGSILVGACPPQLNTDLGGLQLVTDKACEEWCKSLVDQGRRAL